MYQADRTFDIKLQLNEINRRAVQLSATSSELADLAAQLKHLCRLSETIRISANRRVYSTRRRRRQRLARMRPGNTRSRVLLPSKVADEL